MVAKDRPGVLARFARDPGLKSQSRLKCRILTGTEPGFLSKFFKLFFANFVKLSKSFSTNERLFEKMKFKAKFFTN